jgi:hypothetical protein
MKMLTQELREKLPPIGSTEGKLDAPVVVKWFTPFSNWTWWAWEAEDVELYGGTLTVRLFGLVSGFETELGYFALSELEEVRGPMGMAGVERDLYWHPCTVEQLLEKQYPDLLVALKREGG